MLIIRLVIQKEGMLDSLYEMRRYQRNGKRDLSSLERFLDKADEAIVAGKVPTFEFSKEV